MKVVKRILAWLCLAILVAGVAVTGAIGVQGYWMYRDALSQTPLEEKVEAVRAQEDYVPLSGLPPIYAQAVVAAEDRRFYEHGGFDIISTARAALANLRTGTLAFAQRLCVMPQAAQEYVVVHEFCHFAHPNHSPAFWAAVEKVLPDYRQREKLLKMR